MARADRDRLAVTLGLDAGDAAVLGGQAGQRGIEHDRHIALAQRAAQPADQRIAHGQPAIAMGLPPPRPVEPEFREDLGRGPLPAARPVGQRRGLREVQRIAVEQLEGEGLLAQRMDVLAETRAVDVGRHQAAVVFRSRQRDEIVGDRDHLHLDPDLLDVAHHLRPMIEIGGDAILAELALADRGEIGLGVCSIVFRPVEAVTWDPQAAARCRGGAAIEARLLDHQHAEAEIGRAHRRDQPAGARSDDDDIERVIHLSADLRSRARSCVPCAW